jgi:hypothetical protein
MDGVRIIEANDVCTIGEFERCLLTVWRGQPTAAMFDSRDKALLDVTARLPGRCGYLELIEPTSRPPPGSLRKAAVGIFPKLDNQLSCIGVLIEGTEVRSALVRAIQTAMTFLVKQFQPYKVFKRRSDLAEWAGPLIGAEAGFAARLSPVIDLLRTTVTRAQAGVSST